MVSGIMEHGNQKGCGQRYLKTEYVVKLLPKVAWREHSVAENIIQLFNRGR